MTPEEFRTRREELGLSHAAFAAHLGVSTLDVIRCERAPRYDPFVLALAMAYAELRVEAERKPKLAWSRPVRVSERGGFPATVMTAAVAL